MTNGGGNIGVSDDSDDSVGAEVFGGNSVQCCSESCGGRLWQGYCPQWGVDGSEKEAVVEVQNVSCAAGGGNSGTRGHVLASQGVREVLDVALVLSQFATEGVFVFTSNDLS